MLHRSRLNRSSSVVSIARRITILSCWLSNSPRLMSSSRADSSAILPGIFRSATCLMTGSPSGDLQGTYRHADATMVLDSHEYSRPLLGTFLYSLADWCHLQ